MLKTLFITFLAVCSVSSKPSLPQLPQVTYGGTGSTVDTTGRTALTGVQGVANSLPLGSVTNVARPVLSLLTQTNINTLSFQIVNNLNLPNSAVPAIVAFITELVYLVMYGVTINFANGQLTIGGTSLPSYLTCQTFGSNIAACVICNYDCVYVHNKYGGSCAIDNSKPLTNTTGAKGYDCVCQDTRNDNGTITPVNDVCGPIAGVALDPFVNEAILQFLYARQEGELCIPNGTNSWIGAGCNVDCPRNHQYTSGNCEKTNAVPSNADQTTSTNNGENVYCICSDNPSNATTPQAPAVNL